MFQIPNQPLSAGTEILLEAATKQSILLQVSRGLCLHHMRLAQTGRGEAIGHVTFSPFVSWQRDTAAAFQSAK